jgi:hypothetical protein
MQLKIILFLIFCTLSLFHHVWNKKVSNSISEIRDFIFTPKIHEALLSLLFVFGCLSALINSVLWIILAAQIITLLLCYLINAILRASSGLDSSDKKDKIFSIALWTLFKITTNGVGWLLFMKLAKIFFKTSILIAIVIFWIYPIDSTEKNTLILVLYYLVPALTGSIVLLSARARMMLFYEVDEDSRESFVLQSTLVALYLFAECSIPLLLISQMPKYFSLNNTIAWGVFFFPFVLFILFVSGPYFIARRRHLHYLNSLSEYYRANLVECQKIFYLPNPTAQEARLTSLKSEILKDPLLSMAEHRFIEFGVFLETDLKGNKMMLYVRDKLFNKQKAMEQWDCSFYYLTKTNELITYFDLKYFPKMEQYIKTNIDDIKFLINKNVSKKTLLGIILFAIVSGIFAYLFRKFEPALLELLDRLG